MELVDDLRFVEFQDTCQTCDWSRTLRELRCGGRHQPKLITWTARSGIVSTVVASETPLLLEIFKKIQKKRGELKRWII